MRVFYFDYDDSGNRFRTFLDCKEIDFYMAGSYVLCWYNCEGRLKPFTVLRDEIDYICSCDNLENE